MSQRSSNTKLLLGLFDVMKHRWLQTPAMCNQRQCQLTKAGLDKILFLWFPVHFKIMSDPRSVASVTTEAPLCEAWRVSGFSHVLKKHFTSRLRHRFILGSVVVTDFSPNRCTSDNGACTCHTLKRLPVVWLSLYTFCHLQLLSIPSIPIEIHVNTAPDSGPWVSGDELNWWAVNGALGGLWGQSAIFASALLSSPCCSTMAWLIECDAILHNRMSSIVPLNKGALSPIDGQLIFFLVFWMWRGGVELVRVFLLL